MANYLGDQGDILLQRQSDKVPVTFELLKDDINVNVNRFSVDRARSFITGDRLRIQTLDGSPLELVANNPGGASSPDITAFVNVNAVGGLRLYGDFKNSIEDNKNAAFTVQMISADTHVRINLESGTDFLCCGQVQDYQITTRRENLDTTSLSDQYREQYEHGLIEGQGRFTAFFPILDELCNRKNMSGEELTSEYFTRLVMRLTYGSDFSARFILYQNPEVGGRDIWYECNDCIVNNVSVTVSPKELLIADIDFVTSGPFVLRIGQLLSVILLEGLERLGDDSDLLTEQGKPIQLLDPE